MIGCSLFMKKSGYSFSFCEYIAFSCFNGKHGGQWLANHTNFASIFWIHFSLYLSFPLLLYFPTVAYYCQPCWQRGSISTILSLTHFFNIHTSLGLQFGVLLRVGTVSNNNLLVLETGFVIHWIWGRLTKVSSWWKSQSFWKKFGVTIATPNHTVHLPITRLTPNIIELGAWILIASSPNQ